MLLSGASKLLKRNVGAQLSTLKKHFSLLNMDNIIIRITGLLHEARVALPEEAYKLCYREVVPRLQTWDVQDSLALRFYIRSHRRQCLWRTLMSGFLIHFLCFMQSQNSYDSRFDEELVFCFLHRVSKKRSVVKFCLTRVNIFLYLSLFTGIKLPSVVLLFILWQNAIFGAICYTSKTLLERLYQYLSAV